MNLTTKALIAVIISVSSYSFSQNVPHRITFDTTLTNTYGSAEIYLRNPTMSTLTFFVRTLTPQFVFGSNIVSVSPMDSVLFTVQFLSNQNISYNEFLIFESPGFNYSIVHYLSATAMYPDAIYRFTQGLSDEALKIALKTFCSTNTNNNYTTSRTAMYSTIDDYNMDDTIECVYTGRKVYTTGIPSVNPPQSMNTEHTFPQGFFNQDEPMRSDIHHLYPTDETSNSRRANYDFGNVVSNISWQVGGSKLGNDAGGNLVFEARDVHKGNVARCLFYFLIRYQNYGSFMDQTQESVLRQWNRLDTVDAKEIFRENGIDAFQHNRSPFVDHPEFIDRIKSTFTVIPVTAKPEISASPFNYDFDTLAVNDTASLYLTLFNYGAGSLTISSVTSSSPQFTVTSYPSSISQSEFAYAIIKFRPDLLNHTYTSTLIIQNNDSAISVNVTGRSNNTTGVTTISSAMPFEYSLSQNYPNPFNPSTNLEFGISNWGFVSLKIYNVVGNEVAILVNQVMPSGRYEVQWDASDFPGGVYYYKLVSENFALSRKMMLIK